jgi:hypothetical protein
MDATWGSVFIILFLINWGLVKWEKHERRRVGDDPDFTD